MINAKQIGTVVQFDARAGWGFLSCADFTRFFVHIKDIAEPGSPGFPTLVNGQRVSFDVVQTPKGLRAKNVVVLS